MHLNRETKLTVHTALKEDIGRNDITTSLSVSNDVQAHASIIAKEKGTLCGIGLAKEVFKQLDTKIFFKPFKKDGQSFKKGEKIAAIAGKACKILTAERVALNFLSLLSGISTHTKKFVDKTKGANVKILDTRKTTPNLRSLQKYAVVMGAGYSHRPTLAQGILIKDNHLRAGKYIKKGKLNEEKIDSLIKTIRKKSRLKIEVEVESLSEFKALIKCKPDIIMLDNFSLKNTKFAVYFRNKYFPNVKLEASGGIRLNNIKKIANTGVDFISIGTITHSAPSVDFSLEIL